MPSGTTYSGNGSASDRRITQSSRTRSNPCLVASLRAAGWSACDQASRTFWS